MVSSHRPLTKVSMVRDVFFLFDFMYFPNCLFNMSPHEGYIPTHNVCTATELSTFIVLIPFHQMSRSYTVDFRLNVAECLFDNG